MISQIGLPHPALQEYVSQYLLMEYDFAANFLSPCISRGLSSLMFPIREVASQTICRESTNNIVFKSGEVYLFGQATEVQWVNAQGKVVVLFAVLQPLALHQLMREQAAVFTDKTVTLSDWYPQSKIIIERLCAAKSLQEQLVLLDVFFFELFKQARPKTDETDSSLYYIFQSKGLISVEELARKERVSTRNLQRKFNEKVGMPPKMYVRTIRFRALMQYLLTHSDATLLDLACLFNYHDHSHLIKDFYHFTGNTPAHYLKQEQIVDGYFLKYL